jgi:predicted GNAT family acetyltransferase
MSEVIVTDNPDLTRYEARIDGELTGFAEYRLAGRRIVFSHTEVDESREGEGIGGALARFALDDVRDNRRLEVVPICPFIAGWIKRHPAYAGLVTPALRAQFETKATR